MISDPVIGGILLFFGVLSGLAHLFSWRRLFWKLEAMQARFGQKTGSVIHFVAYAALPTLLGFMMVFGHHT